MNKHIYRLVVLLLLPCLALSEAQGWVAAAPRVTNPSFDHSGFEYEALAPSPVESRPPLIGKDIYLKLHRREFIVSLVSFLGFQTISFAQPDPRLHLIYIYARKYKIDPIRVMAVIHVESHYDESITSLANAQGLMQLTPDTARWLAERIGLTNYKDEDLKDPETNIELGCAYLRILQDEFPNNPRAVLVAYLEGMKPVKKFLETNTLANIDDGILSDVARDYVHNVESREVYLSAKIKTEERATISSPALEAFTGKTTQDWKKDSKWKPRMSLEEDWSAERHNRNGPEYSDMQPGLIRNLEPRNRRKLASPKELDTSEQSIIDFLNHADVIDLIRIGVDKFYADRMVVARNMCPERQFEDLGQVRSAFSIAVKSDFYNSDNGIRRAYGKIIHLIENSKEPAPDSAVRARATYLLRTANPEDLQAWIGATINLLDIKESTLPKVIHGIIVRREEPIPFQLIDLKDVDGLKDLHKFIVVVNKLYDVATEQLRVKGRVSRALSRKSAMAHVWMDWEEDPTGLGRSREGKFQQFDNVLGGRPGLFTPQLFIKQSGDAISGGRHVSNEMILDFLNHADLISLLRIGADPFFAGRLLMARDACPDKKFANLDQVQEMLAQVVLSSSFYDSKSHIKKAFNKIIELIKFSDRRTTPLAVREHAVHLLNVATEDDLHALLEAIRPRVRINEFTITQIIKQIVARRKDSIPFMLMDLKEVCGLTTHGRFIVLIDKLSEMAAAMLAGENHAKPLLRSVDSRRDA